LVGAPNRHRSGKLYDVLNEPIGKLPVGNVKRHARPAAKVA